MGEKLIIKNFGPIKSVELDLGRFNVLIGEQATGKSTVAKVLAVCRYFSYIIEAQDPWSPPFQAGLVAWGLNEAIKVNSYIYYQCNHYSVTAENEVENIYDPDSEMEQQYFYFYCKLKPLSSEFANLLDELIKLRPIGEGYPDYRIIVPTSFYQNEVSRIMDNPFYLPAERGLQSIFSLGKNSIQNISDSLFNQFAKLDQIARLFKRDTIIEPLNITYKNVDGKGFVKKSSEDQFYSLYNAASGYQSTIPVVLVIKYYNEIKKKKKTFIIEEPELNLFPAAQQKLAEYLAETASSYESSVFLTTHSPYILTSLNNLIYAYKIGQTYRAETEKVINKKYWLNPDEVSVYLMLPDGTCEDIFDREETLISSEKIDGVSRIINKQFDELLNLEYAKP